MIKHINTGVAEIIAVKVPTDSYGFRMSLKKSNHFIYRLGEEYADAVDLPVGKYEIIGYPFLLTEEAWATLVDKKPDVNSIEYFEDYSGKGWGLDTATESGLSLLAANQVFDKHPMGTNSDSGHNARDREWSEIQQNVGKWVLLKKINEQ